MSRPISDEQAIRVMVGRLASRFDPETIILFGSRARGDARPDSDVDLLVVLSLCENRKAATISMLKAVADLPVGKDIVVASLEELKTRGKLASSVLNAALTEGRVLYAR